MEKLPKPKLTKDVFEEEYLKKEDLKIPRYHPSELRWRTPTIQEMKSGELNGKRFRTSRGKTFRCKQTTATHVCFYNIELERRFARFYLPTKVGYSTADEIKWLKENYDLEHLHVPKTGCQLHGDIWATIKFKGDDKEYGFLWN